MFLKHNCGKIAWIAWDRILAPKDCGGIGVGSFKAANLALLSKWGWKFKTEKNALWRSVITAIHGSSRKHEFLPNRSSISGCWKSIVTTVSNLKEVGVDFLANIKGVAGAGDSISFWHDPWISGGPLKEQYPTLYEIEKFKSVSVQNRTQTSSNTRETVWQWKKRELSVTENSLMDQLSHRIMAYNFKDGLDKWEWLGAKNLEFSTSSVRKIVERNSICFDYKHKWFNWVPKKVSFFVWKAALHRLPVKQELLKRGVELQHGGCSWCYTQDESVPHVLLDCDMAKRAWKLVSDWCRLPFYVTGSVKQLLEWADSNTRPHQVRDLLSLTIMAVLWNIWKVRNAKEFENRNTHPGKILEEIKVDVFMWLKYRAKVLDLDCDRFYDYGLYML